uniref:Alkaline ceramidase n=1 Tax=Phasianus colchicus TaxID=9054 RepID=A0A669PY38_PHACC
MESEKRVKTVFKWLTMLHQNLCVLCLSRRQFQKDAASWVTTVEAALYIESVSYPMLNLCFCFCPTGNTVSNLIFILPPIYGAIRTYKDGLEKRYLAAYLCLTAVGLGSWCFHMTLKYEMQLLDELPMIYSCCVFVYCLYECFKYKNTVNYPMIFILITYSFIVSIVYLKLKQPVFHQIMYGTLVSVIVLRSVYIVLWVYPWLRGLGYTSLTVFLMGFFLWNVDNIFCEKLRALREKMPPVLGAVTQFHAWWHILTGLGSYLHILLSFFLEYGLFFLWSHPGSFD